MTFDESRRAVLEGGRQPRPVVLPMLDPCGGEVLGLTRMRGAARDSSLGPALRPIGVPQGTWCRKIAPGERNRAAADHDGRDLAYGGRTTTSMSATTRTHLAPEFPTPTRGPLSLSWTDAICSKHCTMLVSRSPAWEGTVGA